jgi:hypothetical protein
MGCFIRLLAFITNFFGSFFLLGLTTECFVWLGRFRLGRLAGFESGDSFGEAG